MQSDIGNVDIVAIQTEPGRIIAQIGRHAQNISKMNRYFIKGTLYLKYFVWGRWSKTTREFTTICNEDIPEDMIELNRTIIKKMIPLMRQEPDIKSMLDHHKDEGKDLDDTVSYYIEKGSYIDITHLVKL